MSCPFNKAMESVRISLPTSELSPFLVRPDDHPAKYLSMEKSSHLDCKFGLERFVSR